MGLLNEFEQQYSILTAELTTNIGRLSIVNGGKQKFKEIRKIWKLEQKIENYNFVINRFD